MLLGACVKDQLVHVLPLPSVTEHHTSAVNYLSHRQPKTTYQLSVLCISHGGTYS